MLHYGVQLTRTYPYVGSDSESASITFECMGTGMFSPSYGKNVLTRTALIGQDNVANLKKSGYITSTTTSSAYEGSAYESVMSTHSCALSVPAADGSAFSYFFAPPVDSVDGAGKREVVALRVMSMTVIGSSATQVHDCPLLYSVQIPDSSCNRLQKTN